MSTTTVLPLYNFDALTAMGRATAYPPLPIEPFEERAAPSLLVADNKPAPQPKPEPAQPSKPAYEPLPTEPDTRKIKPGTTR
jgi:hypothetical protein